MTVRLFFGGALQRLGPACAALKGVCVPQRPTYPSLSTLGGHHARTAARAALAWRGDASDAFPPGMFAGFRMRVNDALCTAFTSKHKTAHSKAKRRTRSAAHNAGLKMRRHIKSIRRCRAKDKPAGFQCRIEQAAAETPLPPRPCFAARPPCRPT